MRIGELIYNLDGQPFRTPEMAQRMRRLLVGESQGEVRYVVEPYPPCGYVVRRQGQDAPRADARPRTGEVGRDVLSASLPPTGSFSRSCPNHRFRPAVIRQNLPWVPVLALATVLTLTPDGALDWTLQRVHLHAAVLGEWWTPITKSLRYGAGFLAGGILVFFWSERISSAYNVTAAGVEAQIGIVARNSVALRFADIRSVTLKQSLWERLLNIGTLEFTSAGTDGQPVRFDGVGRPGWIKTVVEAQMERRSAD